MAKAIVTIAGAAQGALGPDAPACSGNGRSGWSDGGGFSRNPRLSLPNPRPSHRQVAIDAPAGVQAIDIVLNCRSGFSIGPAGSGER